ncbi:alpha-D-ribose 1-methylphosphonate 5-triphosphate diphosphatase [uncultured Desulfobacter sp.]|uniref:alpha-D-ribose 1-methylphosphonate 5-triphosphate diphosphatase n=1 Tax=uncultured Desulfobacter sp. TaxID=240139 RepID=UPI002AAABF8F|nr:alpha-D-ribose 1-methylphosphonate 5-triphosphate diphosphatase [uncultured Desulfobacter sp.]
MTFKKVICNGPVFDGRHLFHSGAVLMDGDKISSVFDAPVQIPDARIIDARGHLIMPGIVDLHSDSLERSIEKRKGVFFDIDFAILNLDRSLAACGITSFFHAISFADNELGLRSPKAALQCLRQIKDYNDSGQALVKHFTHVRYEVGSEESFAIIKELVQEGLIDLLSIMDHTPGQGQFTSMASYIKFHACEYAIPHEEIQAKAVEKQSRNIRAWQMVSELTQLVAQANIPMLSHDDDTLSKIDLIHRLGIRACEFPVTAEAAEAAHCAGMKIFMGAPNLLRNQSTNGNLKASQALSSGHCNGLVSDYYPESLVQAAFVAAEYTGDLPCALGQVTSGPGSFMGHRNGAGTLEPGKDADIIIVNRQNRWAHVTRAFVRGRSVYDIQTP